MKNKLVSQSIETNKNSIKINQSKILNTPSKSFIMNTTDPKEPQYQIKKRPDSQETPEKNPAKPAAARKKRNSAQTESFDQILSRIASDFNDVHPLESIAKMLNVHVAYIILGVFTLSFFPIIIGFYPRFFVGLLGFLYPSYQSLQTAGKNDRDSLKQWISYWVLFTILEVNDCLLIMVFNYFLPFFYPLKALLLIWLFYPKSKGASLIYEKALRKAYAALKEMRDDTVVDEKTEEFFKGSS